MGFDSTDSGDGPVANINVTPLVDVMLVLLVIFMVTAPMLQHGVEVNLPKVKAGSLSGDEEQLVISIDKEGVVYLGEGNKVVVAELPKKIKAIMEAKKTEGEKIYIKGDQEVSYGKFMEVMSVLNEGGITQIGLLSELPKPKKG